MLKEAIEKIVSLADKHIYTVGDESFTNDRDMRRIEPKIYHPAGAIFSSLDGILQSIRAEIAREEIAKPLFVSVESEFAVSVFTTLRADDQTRDTLYEARAVLPQRFDRWMSHEDAMIALRSQFIPGDGTAYLLDLLAHISDENSVKSTDNGMTQTVNARTGVALAANVSVKPIVALRPYRTFLEVEQPESEFLVRMKPGDKERGVQAQIGILEADGGAWKLDARHNIAEYLRDGLEVYVKNGTVIVAE